MASMLDIASVAPVAPDDDLDLWLVPQVADYLGVSVSTVHRWLKRGVFPHAIDRGPIRRRWQIPRGDVLAIERTWTQQQEPPP